MARQSGISINITSKYSGDGLDKAQRELRKFQTECAKNSSGIQSSLVSAGQSITAYGDEVSRFGDGMVAVGSKISKVTAPLGVVGVAAGKMSMDFENAMAKVSTIADENEVSMDKMKAGILDLSTQTGVAASSIAEDVYNAISAGQKTGDAVAYVGNAVKLAKAGFTDSASALDVLTTTMNAYRMSADQTSHVSDVLLQTQNKGKTTVAELSQSIGRAIPTAAAFNVSLENLAAAYATTTANGIATRQSTTYLNSMIKELGDTGSVVGGILKSKTGKSFSELMAEGKSLGDVINVLNEEGAATGKTMYDMFGSAEGATAAATLASNGAAQFSENLQAMNDSAGLTDTSFEKMRTNSSKFTKAINNVKNTLIDLGDSVMGVVAPVAQAAADATAAFNSWFKGIDDGAKTGVVALGALAVATGPVILGAGKLVSTSGKVISTVGKLTTSAGVLVGKLNGTVPLTKEQAAAMQGAERAARADAAATKADAAAKGANATASKAAAAASREQGAATGAATTATKASTTATKASTVAINAGKLAATGLKTALRAIAPIAVISGVMALAQGIGAMYEDAKKTQAAMTGLTGAVDAARVAYSSAKSPIESMTASMGANVVTAKQCVDSQAQLAQKMGETWADVGTKSAIVDAYASTIGELANRNGLTALEQEKLKAAVEGFNEETGSSIAVIDAQNGKLSESVERINETAAAWKKEAEAQAARELYKDTAKQLIQNEQALEAATQNLAKAQEGLNNETDPQLLAQYQAQVNSAQAEVDRLTQVTQQSRDAANQLLGVMTNGLGGFATFNEAIASCGVSMSDFGAVTAEQLAAMQQNFDGSLASIVQTCVNQGVQIPQSLADGIMANSGLPVDQASVMYDAMILQLTNGDVEQAARILGHDIDEGLKAGIEGSGDMPQSAVGKMSDDVIERAREHFQTHSPSQVFYGIGTDVGQGLANGITGSTTTASGAMSGVGAAVISSISGLPGSAYATGDSSGAQLAGGIGARLGDVRGAAGALSAGAQAGVSGAPGAFSATGGRAASWFSSAIGSSSAYGSGARLAGTANSGLGSVDAGGTGENFVRGFTGGFGRIDVFRAACDIGNRALDAIKKTLGIASPSKEAAKLGAFFGEGLVVGMDGTRRDVARSASGLADAMASDPVITPTSGAGFTGTPTVTPSAPARHVEINIYVDGSRVRTGVSAKMDSALSDVIAEAERYANMGDGYGF